MKCLSNKGQRNKSVGLGGFVPRQLPAESTLEYCSALWYWRTGGNRALAPSRARLLMDHLGFLSSSVDRSREPNENRRKTWVSKLSGHVFVDALSASVTAVSIECVKFSSCAAFGTQKKSQGSPFFGFAVCSAPKSAPPARITPPPSSHKKTSWRFNIYSQVFLLFFRVFSPRHH